MIKRVYVLMQFFYSNIKAVVSIEIAYILPILLTLIMGILEFSYIFSMRAGIEEVSREIARIKLSVSGANQYGQSIGRTKAADTDDKLMSELIGQRLSQVVLNPEQAEVCSSHFDTVAQLLANTSAVSGCSTAARLAGGQTLAMGQEGDYVRVNINYRHDYLTPIGGLISTLGNNITFDSITYFRKEVN